jgi:hypothetical protein
VKFISRILFFFYPCRIRNQLKTGIRIRNKSFRIHNTEKKRCKNSAVWIKWPPCAQERSPSPGSDREVKRGRKEKGRGRRSWSHSPIHKSRKHRSRSRDRLSSSSKHRWEGSVCTGMLQGCGSVSALIWVAGSGSRGAEMTHKNRKKQKKIHVLKCWMFSFEGWKLLL